MFAVASGRTETLPAPSVGNSIRHGVIVGTAAALVQLALLLALAYACGIIAA